MRITQSMRLNNTLKQNSIHNTQINVIIIDVFSPICVSDENYCCLERRETKYKEKPDAKEKSVEYLLKKLNEMHYYVLKLNREYGLQI